MAAGVAGCGSCANNGAAIAIDMAIEMTMASALKAPARTGMLDVGIGLLI
jgi:hypothetical protein